MINVKMTEEEYQAMTQLMQLGLKVLSSRMNEAMAEHVAEKNKAPEDE